MRPSAIHLLCSLFLTAVVAWPVAGEAAQPNLHASGPAGAASDPIISSEDLPLGPPAGRSRAGAAADSGSGAWLLQTLMALGVVIGLIFGVRLLLQRAAGMRRGAGGSSGQLIEVLARTPLGPKTQILFLRIHHRVIIAAQSPAGLDTLAILDDPEELAWVLSQSQAAQPRSITRSFRQAMSRAESEYEPPKAGTPSTTPASAHEGVANLLSRIQGLKGRGKGGGL